MHHFVWDLDKTYLQTEIRSVRGMVRAALEPAAEKRNVPGSATLLRGLQRHDPTSMTTVVSGSPTQMRGVLAQKLALDGVRVDRMVLKDSLQALRRGRLRTIWSQIGYKLPALLEIRATGEAGDAETLFGDDTEVDGVVYTVYADAISGRISAEQLGDVLTRGGAYEDDVSRSIELLARCPRADCVEDIFIRLDGGGPLRRFDKLGPRVTPVFSWLQAAMILSRRGRLENDALDSIVREVMGAGDLDANAVAGLFQDAARRHLVGADFLLNLVHASPSLRPLREPIGRALHHLGTPGVPGSSSVVADPIGFLDDQG